MKRGTLSLGLLTGACLLAAAFCFGCAGDSVPSYTVAVGGHVDQGKTLIESKGCGGCHTIPGIPRARGLVGPPLYFWSRRTMIAGELPNTPENLIRWIKDPKAVEPGTAMPDLGLNDQQARDVAAYLYTLH